ncbi:DUF4956 domain-containing protein [bacterium]|nr:DUF4956 domain-containing protein [bacterium]
MFSDFQNLQIFQITLEDIVANLLVSMLCGMFIAFVYRRTYKGPGYTMSYVHSIVLLTVITTMVIMIIGNNLARAFGLVGAMSIIRFRTAVKETYDIVFIFFGLAAGLAAGAGARMIAVVGTLFIGGIVFVLARSRSFTGVGREYLLQFSARQNGTADPPYIQVLDKHCRQHRVVNVKTADDSDALLLSYFVQLRKQDRNQDFLRDLRAVPGVRQINLYYDEEQY